MAALWIEQASASRWASIQGRLSFVWSTVCASGMKSRMTLSGSISWGLTRRSFITSARPGGQ